MEGQFTDQYFIFEDSKTGCIFLEHIYADKYQMIKDWIKRERVIYQTEDIMDSELSQTGIDEIIWERHVPLFDNKLRKVLVPFSPDNYEEMEKLAKQKIIEMDIAYIAEKK